MNFLIGILSRIFIKDYKNYKDKNVRAQYGVLCSVTAIILNILLAAAKFAVGTLSGSISVTADAVNNLTDAGSSVLTFIGFRFSGKKPDPDHPFGHGRIDYIMGMIVAGIILIVGFETLRDSALTAIAQIKHWIKPAVYADVEAVEFSWITVAVLVMSIAVKFYMAFFMKKTGKKIDSPVMKATGADAMGDTVSTFLALICLFIFRFFGLNLDAFAGILVAIIIFKAGIDSAKETLVRLLGGKADAELVKDVKDAVMEYDEVIGVHDMIIHDYGPGRFFVSLHAEVDGSGDIYKLHDAMDRIAMMLNARFGCEAVVHMDPVNTKDERTIYFRERVAEISNMINPELDCHDVRIVPGRTHTNIIFDVVVPFGYKQSDDELRAEFSRRLKEKDPDCFCAVTIDKPYA